VKRSKYMKTYVAYKRLKELHQNKKTITYGELGGMIDTHYRQVGGIAGKIQDMFVAYNKRHGAQVPPLNALVVNKRTKRPGYGCNIEDPKEVLDFDYTMVFPEIERQNFLCINIRRIASV